MKKLAINSVDSEIYQQLFDMLDPTKIVSVYKNLHTGLWSIVQSGKVVCHANYIVLRDVRFTVRPSGRARVLAEKRKNVHAFVKGYIVSDPARVPDTGDWQAVTYNPYKYGYFYDKYTDERVDNANFVDMCLVNTEYGEPVMAV